MEEKLRKGRKLAYWNRRIKCVYGKFNNSSKTIETGLISYKISNVFDLDDMLRYYNIVQGELGDNYRVVSFMDTKF